MGVCGGGGGGGGFAFAFFGGGGGGGGWRGGGCGGKGRGGDEEGFAFGSGLESGGGRCAGREGPAVASCDALHGGDGRRRRRRRRRAAVGVLLQFAVERGLLQDGFRRVFVRLGTRSPSHLDQGGCCLLLRFALPGLECV